MEESVYKFVKRALTEGGSERTDRDIRRISNSIAAVLMSNFEASFHGSTDTMMILGSIRAKIASFLPATTQAERSNIAYAAYKNLYLGMVYDFSEWEK